MLKRTSRPTDALFSLNSAGASTIQERDVGQMGDKRLTASDDVIQCKLICTLVSVLAHRVTQNSLVRVFEASTAGQCPRQSRAGKAIIENQAQLHHRRRHPFANECHRHTGQIIDPTGRQKLS